VDLRHRVRIEELLFFSSARLRYVDRREDAALGELSIELNLEIAGTLEFLEDHFVHLASGVDQCCADDCERASFFGLARGPEELAREFKSARIDSARHRSPA